MCAFLLSFLLCSTQYTLCNVHCVFVSTQPKFSAGNSHCKWRSKIVVSECFDPFEVFSCLCSLESQFEQSQQDFFQNYMGLQEIRLMNCHIQSLVIFGPCPSYESRTLSLISSIFFAFFTFLTVSVHKRHILVKNRWFQSKPFFPWHDISCAHGLTIYSQ